MPIKQCLVVERNLSAHLEQHAYRVTPRKGWISTSSGVHPTRLGADVGDPPDTREGKSASMGEQLELKRRYDGEAFRSIKDRLSTISVHMGMLQPIRHKHRRIRIVKWKIVNALQIAATVC